MCFVAPTCFNTTNCEGGSFSDNSLSYVQCCFELSGASFALSGECLLCPKGMYVPNNIRSFVIKTIILYGTLV